MKINTINENSIDLVNDFLNENNNYGEILHRLKNDPNSNEAKKYGKSVIIFLKLLVEM